MKTDFDQLESAIAIYRKFLPSKNLQIFDISSLDRLGVPVYMAALQGDDRFLNNGVGYGNSVEEAMVGALGELSETFHVHNALKTAPTCEAISYHSMVCSFGQENVIDPLTICLSAGYPYNENLPLRWVAVTRFGDSAPCWAPRELVAYSGFSYDTHSSNVEIKNGTSAARLFPPVTCGMGAGMGLHQALSHGLLELLQRDGNCTAFRAMDRGIDIDLDEIKSEEVIITVSHLKTLGLNVRAKLASTEFGMVNMYVVAEAAPGIDGTEMFPLMVTACGEAVHPDREQALRKALHELISSRSRKTFMHGPIAKIKAFVPTQYINSHIESVKFQNEELRALTEMAGWLSKSQAELNGLLEKTVFSSRQTVRFSSFPSSSKNLISESGVFLKDLADRVAAQNIQLFYFDGSPSALDGPKVVKAIAPGLEGETLSYWRLGERGAKRLLSQGSALVSQNFPQPQHMLIPLRPAVEEALGGKVFFKLPEWERILNGHYPLYREPAPHTAQQYLNRHER